MPARTCTYKGAHARTHTQYLHLMQACAVFDARAIWCPILLLLLLLLLGGWNTNRRKAKFTPMRGSRNAVGAAPLRDSAHVSSAHPSRRQMALQQQQQQLSADQGSGARARECSSFHPTAGIGKKANGRMALPI